MIKYLLKIKFTDGEEVKQYLSSQEIADGLLQIGIKEVVVKDNVIEDYLVVKFYSQCILIAPMRSIERYILLCETEEIKHE